MKITGKYLLTLLLSLILFAGIAPAQKKNKKEKRERDLAKIVRGGVRFAKARVSVLSRRNPSSERNREEIKRRELRVTLHSERIHRSRSDGV